MGANDRTPDASQRTKRRGPRAVPEQLHWKAEFAEAIASVTEAISGSGGYVGFGRNRAGDCLLLYVKLGDWNERIAIESYDEVLPVLADVLGEI